MARVSHRIGWGRSSAVAFAVTAFNVLLAAGLYSAGYPVVALIAIGFAAMSTLFGLIHPHRILELDEDDDPRRRVGDLVDDELD